MNVFNGAYISGLFDGNSCQSGPTGKAMAQSMMSDYLIWSVHVSETGDLFYNNTELAKGGTSVADTISCIKHVIPETDAPLRVWLSIGAWSVPDFTNIDKLLKAGGAGRDNLLGNLCAVAKDLGAYGFDYDNEDAVGSVDVIVDLTVALYEKDNAFRFSYCPYANAQYWLQCLQQTYAKLGTQPVEGWNLQCYAGGGGNDPRDWVGAVDQAGASSTGIDNAATLVRPGYAVIGSDAAPEMTPDQVRDALAASGCKGAWIWNSESVLKNGTSPSIKDYADAIYAATK